MSPVKIPNLPELVTRTFNKAKANGDVNFYPTQVTVLTSNGTPFQLRFSPSLANKPKPQPKSKPSNPFANPPAALIIHPLEPSHLLVLNKFAIVPEHFLLITKIFAPQTHLLEARDLAAAHACIESYAAAAGGRELFAFFNSGPHSGASQAHRHVQLLPVDKMQEGLLTSNETDNNNDTAKRWEVLADRLAAAHNYKDDAGAAALPELPFATFAAALRPDMNGEELWAVYLRLYGRACAAAGVEWGNEVVDGGGCEAGISYNMAMTRWSMVICPRTAEGAAVLGVDGEEVGKLALNGTVLAGTALVKNEAEWDALRTDPTQLWTILGNIGPSPRAQVEKDGEEKL